jgi:hypothetical protein
MWVLCVADGDPVVALLVHNCLDSFLDKSPGRACFNADSQLSVIELIEWQVMPIDMLTCNLHSSGHASFLRLMIRVTHE